MTESQTIEAIQGMDAFEKLKVYMNYYVNALYFKYAENSETEILTNESFCSESNINKIDVGDKWQERGFASRSWVNFNRPSIYSYIHLEIR